jgi:hypothetical protein
MVQRSPEYPAHGIVNDYLTGLDEQVGDHAQFMMRATKGQKGRATQQIKVNAPFG